MLTRAIIVFIVSTCGFPRAVQENNANPEKIIRTAVSTFVENHFKKLEINEQFCRSWLDTYIETLDPARLYFLAEDISAFETDLDKLPEMASSGDPRFLRLVTDRYQARVGSALKHALERIDGDFDFSIDEKIMLKYEDWPKTNEDRIERWRLQLKHDLLLERTRFNNNHDVVTFLKNRYESILQQASTINEEQAVGLYLDSFCRTADPHSGYFTQTEYAFFRGGMLKEYSIGLDTTISGGRTVIQGIGSEFQSEPAVSKILGCELLAIRSLDGTFYNIREIFPTTHRQLIKFGLKQDSTVTLELYDKTRQRRFAVRWPRK